MLFKLLNLNSNLALTLGYLNPALNNSVQEGRGLKQKCPLLGGGVGHGYFLELHHALQIMTVIK